MSKLRFRVVHSSSEDNGYPSSELNAHNPSTRGWQSVKFCQFPQELGFQLSKGPSQLSQVQILSHQSKIATKVEIFLGSGKDYHSATFKRLGYLSLDSNERSSYQARELKTVYIDQTGEFIKLLIHKNYVNKQNMFSQVGIVALNLLGSEDDYSPGVDAPAPSTSSNPSSHSRPIVSNPLNDLSVDMNLDPTTAEKLRLLSDAKAKAVETEDYTTAKKIKIVEGELKTLGTQLAQLDMAKRLAVADEDYDKAKEIKDEVDILRAEIEEKIIAIHIPGVTDRNPQQQQHQQQINSSRGGNINQNQLNKNTHQNNNINNSNNNYKVVDRDYNNESKNNNDGRSIPVNIDDLPVGKGNSSSDQASKGGSGSGSGNYGNDSNADSRFSSSNNNKNNRKSSPRGGGRGDYHDDNTISSPVHGQNSEVTYSTRDDRKDKGEADQSKSRNSKIKDNGSYDAKDSFSGSNDALRDDEDEHIGSNHFPPGEHPLEGVPSFHDLSAPEGLKGNSREFSEQFGITHLIGEYRARCLFSKTWAIRDACVYKIQMMLQEEFQQKISSCLPALAAIIRVGAEDKIQQVLFAAIGLMDSILAATRRAKLSRSVVAPLFDPVVTILIEKLSDGNVRIREGARKGLEVLAASSNIGAAVVGAHGLKSLSSKQALAWRPISARLQLLTDLVSTYGVGSGSGLATDSVMNFAKSCGAFTHSNAEVRDSAKELTVAVHAVVGTAAIDTYLKMLRKNQLEEYHAAFEAAKANGGNNVGQRKVVDAHSPPQDQKGSNVPSSKSNNSNNNAGNSSGSKSANSGGKGDDHGLHEGELAPDFTTCMFCGDHDNKWNEDALDLHYWKDCALLAPCPACAQVVEVAGMPEHLLDECDQKESFVLCDVTGLAIRETEMTAWVGSSKCCQAPANCMYCPLCLASVEDSNEAWKEHLIYHCPDNKRGSNLK